MNAHIRLSCACLLALAAGGLVQVAGRAQSSVAPEPAHVGWCGGVRLAYTDRPAVRPAGPGDFHIVPTYGAEVTAAQIRIIEHAIAEWESVLQTCGVNPCSYPVEFRFYGAGGFLSQAITTRRTDGSLHDSKIVVDPNYQWYEDANPATDDEFDATPPPWGYDLLTVVRHELGHTVGWIPTSRWTSLMVNDVFDPTRLNIAMDSNHQHVDAAAHPGELMEPSIAASVRRPIRLYPTVALCARAFEYQIPMRFADPNYSGTQRGTAWQPWQSVLAALEAGPADVPLLLAPAVFTVPKGQRLTTPRTVSSARGGARIVGE